MIGAEELTFLSPTTTVCSLGPMTLEELEITHIKAALDACRGNISRAAKQLGVDRSTLMRKMKRYHLARS